MKDFDPRKEERKYLIYFIAILLLPILATYLMLILAAIL
ncbi:MAG: hypothetical protein BWY21_01572 [Parcubacteria group bacterium ADurb.Bin216]|nr:MAG: hypothetical protein BWY21_01572 [Parcubacteria group bacterium ADurb.Bin216]